MHLKAFTIFRHRRQQKKSRKTVNKVKYYAFSSYTNLDLVCSKCWIMELRIVEIPCLKTNPEHNLDIVFLLSQLVVLSEIFSFLGFFA